MTFRPSHQKAPGPDAPTGFNPAWFHLLAGITMLAWAALAWRSRNGGAGGQLAWLLLTQAIAWAALGLAAGLRTGPSGGPSNVSVLGWALAFRMCGLLAEPVLEDDYFRYLWDGRMTVTTGNPYARPPADFFQSDGLPPVFEEILGAVNYPHTTTVYGPTSQIAFALAYLVAPGQIWPWKLLLLLAEAGIVTALRSRLPGHRLLFLTWCPLAVFETAFNAHPEVIGIVLLTFAWTRSEGTSSPVLTGVLCALSGGAKVFGWLVSPFVLAHRSRLAWTAFGLTLAGLYFPFLIQGTSAEFAGLSAMAADWEFNSSLYALAAWAWGPAAARPLCLALTALSLGWIGWRWRRSSDPSRPPAEAVFGVLFLLSATVNPWYLLWLWPFVAQRPSVTGVTALIVVTLSYCTGQNLGKTDLATYNHPAWVRPVEFGLLALAGWVDWHRWRRKIA